MKLSDFATQTKYLKWSETDDHDIVLNCEYKAFLDIEPTFSERHESSQYEIPIICLDYIADDIEPYECLLATKSKYLCSKLLEYWSEDRSRVVRLNKKGSGFYTKWTLVKTDKYYDYAGKSLRKPAKKK